MNATHPEIRAAVAAFEAARRASSDRADSEPQWEALGKALQAECVAVLVLDGVCYSSACLVGEMRDWDNPYGAEVFPASFVLDLDAG